MAFPSRILLVEDERLLAQNLRAFLARRAAEVRVAGDGEQALAMLPAFVPDVAVLDYGLPGMTGLQTYREIVRRRGQRIGCVIITGYPLEKISGLVGEQGIRHLLSKPFSLAELGRLVRLSAEESALLPS